MDCSCASMLRFFCVASHGAATDRQIQDRVFWSISYQFEEGYWLCKISPKSPNGVGMRPQKCQKFPLFGKESPGRGESLDRFLKLLRANAKYDTIVFQIWHDSLHRLRSHFAETARRSIRPNFSVHPVGKTIRCDISSRIRRVLRQGYGKDVDVQGLPEVVARL